MWSEVKRSINYYELSFLKDAAEQSPVLLFSEFLSSLYQEARNSGDPIKMKQVGDAVGALFSGLYSEESKLLKTLSLIRGPYDAEKLL